MSFFSGIHKAVQEHFRYRLVENFCLYMKKTWHIYLGKIWLMLEMVEI